MTRYAERITQSIEFPGGQPLQLVRGNAQRINETVSSTSTDEREIPGEGRLIIVRCTDAIWLRFGNAGMAAAAGTSACILVVPGEGPVPVELDPTTGLPFTRFRMLRVGSSDVQAQVEGVGFKIT